jgi:hypothetical protein
VPLPTVNAAVSSEVAPAVVLIRAVIEWLPLDSVPVLKAVALPLVAVPAKSSGAERSV